MGTGWACESEAVGHDEQEVRSPGLSSSDATNLCRLHLENGRQGLSVLTSPFLMSHEEHAQGLGGSLKRGVWRSECCQLTTEVVLSPGHTSCEAATLTAAQIEASEPSPQCPTGWPSAH